ncbi:MAG: TorF family putative porin [Woeseiaceae bacterium]
MKVTAIAASVVILLATSASGQADWSVNAGWGSEYHYRGIFQATSSTSGGVDFDGGGFYAGSWAVDVKDGLEVDGYFGYGGETGALDYSIGYTGYFYTGDFDDTYQEINLGGSYGILSVDVAIGKYGNFAGPTLDYTYYALTLESDGFYGRYGGFSQDFGGQYFELGYGKTISGIDFGLALIAANDALIGAGDESLVITIGKSFDIQ